MVGLLSTLLVFTCACNRVPSGPLPRLRVAAEASSAVLSTEQEQEPLEPLCKDACARWVELMFPAPAGFDRLPASEAAAVAPLLERQRALNQASCEEACVSAGDRNRARCLLRARTAAEAEECAYR